MLLRDIQYWPTLWCYGTELRYDATVLNYAMVLWQVFVKRYLQSTSGTMLLRYDPMTYGTIRPMILCWLATG